MKLWMLVLVLMMQFVLLVNSTKNPCFVASKLGLPPKIQDFAIAGTYPAQLRTQFAFHVQKLLNDFQVKTALQQIIRNNSKTVHVQSKVARILEIGSYIFFFFLFFLQVSTKYNSISRHLWNTRGVVNEIEPDLIVRNYH